jgi:sulfinoalanine decarboxylase/sulfinoalanine decarboxylase/aspartate 1-decarboxylase
MLLAEPTLEKTFAIIQKLLQAETDTPVLPYQSPQDLQKTLDLDIQSETLSSDHFFALLEQLTLATPRTASRSFFNQLFGGRNLPALSGEILAAVLNSSMYTFKVAGAQVLVEQAVIAKMLAKIGYHYGDGTFAPGGSMANMMAMIVARNEKDASIRNQGLRGQKLLAYTSEEGHYSTTKNAGMLGIGRENVRVIPADAFGKMITQELDNQILSDIQAGFTPFFINATAGTTVLGVYDDFEAIAQVAHKHQVWFHIDGALGGSAILSTRHQHLLKGCQLSDSFTWNAHKMMGVPLTASIVLFNHPNILRRHFSEKAEYLFQSEEDYNPGEQSMQCGRRNDALKVWAAWKYYGDTGYEARINRVFALSQYAAEYIQKDEDLQLLHQPESINICFTVKNKPAAEICDRLDKEGLIKVGYGSFKKDKFIRLVCVNPDMHESDLDHFFAQVKKVAELETIAP